MLLNARTKSFLIIFLTLIIGFGAGFLVNGRLTSRKIQKFKHRMNDKHGFVEYILDEVLETTPEEREVVEPILEAHFAQMDSIGQSFRQSMRREARGLREQLHPHLSQEQLDKMERGMRLHRRKKRGHRPGPHGPPPPPPSP